LSKGCPEFIEGHAALCFDKLSTVVRQAHDDMVMVTLRCASTLSVILSLSKGCPEFIEGHDALCFDATCHPELVEGVS